MKVVIEQTYSSHDNVKTGAFMGTCERVPTVGESFFMLAEDGNDVLIPGHFRTTEVRRVTIHYGDYYFQTQNSAYRLKVLWTEPKEKE